MPEFATRMEGITGSAIRAVFKLLAKGDIISFGGGNPSAESFPTEEIRSIVDSLLARDGANLLQYGPTEGYAPLRRAIAQHILAPKCVHVAEEQILPLTGSMQGFDLLCRVFVNRGDTVLVEAPTFLGVLQTLNLYGAKLVSVPSDEEGVCVDALESLVRKHRPKLFYCIPTFQNPSGRTIGIERRKRIARIAAEYDLLVAEDDPYCDLRYSGVPLPPIKAFDESGTVLLFNSFSKIIAPGLRVGSVTAEAPVIRKMTIAKQSADTHSPNLTQAIVAEFLSRGLLPQQLARILPMYGERMNAMLAAMDAYFPESCAYTRPEGGLFIWGELPGGDMATLVGRAADECGVAFIPGFHFFADPAGQEGTFRLNFSGTAFENIEPGIRRLGALFTEAAGAPLRLPCKAVQ
ncbi:MAG: PLP-dependent aminotransferase family protein [Christensenellaceae bacterium]|nr:PLP-dependent aminotransferase family protein [Christensenellaceae bacterium]